MTTVGVRERTTAPARGSPRSGGSAELAHVREQPAKLRGLREVAALDGKPDQRSTEASAPWRAPPAPPRPGRAPRPIAGRDEELAEVREQRTTPSVGSPLAGEGDRVALGSDRLLVAVAAVERVAEVAVGAQRGGGEVVLERELERAWRERLRVRAACRARSACVFSACGNTSGRPERLRDLERGVDPSRRELDLAVEEVCARRARRRAWRGPRRARRRQSTSKARSIRSIASSSLPARYRRPRRGARRPVRPDGSRPWASKSSSASSKCASRLLEARPRPGRSAGPLAELRLGEWVVGELGRPLEVVLGLLVRRQRGARSAARVSRLAPSP